MAVSIRGDKSICLPVESEGQYRQLITNNPNFRAYLLQLYPKYPEIFPAEMDQGFCFHDWVVSSKQQLPMRRIKLKENSEVYQLRPDFIMPYMVGKTDEIEKPMYLRQLARALGEETSPSSLVNLASPLRRSLTFSVVILCIGIAFTSL